MSEAILSASTELPQKLFCFKIKRANDEIETNFLSFCDED